MSREEKREVMDRKNRNNGVTNKTTPSERERERTDSLLVVWDEINKEQDNLFFFRLGTKNKQTKCTE